MPQAIQTITFQLAEQPTGIFYDITQSRFVDLVGECHRRLDQVVAMVSMMKDAEALDPFTSRALGGIETAIEDAAALLTIVPQQVAA